MNPASATLTQTRVSESDEHILFVLTANERKLFLPEADFNAFAEHSSAFIDPTGMTPADWEQCLGKQRPTVLVTAWSAHPLPLAWCRSEDLPLRYISHITGSVRGVVPRELITRGVQVTNWGTIITHTVAEHALLLVLSLLRNTPRWPEAATSGKYTGELMGLLRTRSLRGKRVGLHGFGSIARELVRLLQPFQVELSAWSPGVPPEVFAAYEINAAPSLQILFEQSDVLIECESLTAHSRGLVTDDLLRRLPPDAVFVNVGRGQVVDEAAVCQLAREGRLRVGLDVFHREPLAPDSALHHVPGLLISPHIAGPTWDTYHLCGDHALANLRNYLEGTPLEGLITLEAYDRIT